MEYNWKKVSTSQTPTKMRLSEAREQKEIAFERECREMGKINAMKKQMIEETIKSELERLHLILELKYYTNAKASIQRLIELNDKLSTL
jgi:hypothetical protein